MACVTGGLRSHWAPGKGTDLVAREGREDAANTGFTSECVCSFDGETILSLVVGDASSARVHFSLGVYTFIAG